MQLDIQNDLLQGPNSRHMSFDQKQHRIHACYCSKWTTNTSVHINVLAYYENIYITFPVPAGPITNWLHLMFDSWLSINVKSTASVFSKRTTYLYPRWKLAILKLLCTMYYSVRSVTSALIMASAVYWVNVSIRPYSCRLSVVDWWYRYDFVGDATPHIGKHTNTATSLSPQEIDVYAQWSW